MKQRYDHIIVGAGSAGAVLAARLTEDPHRSVLLLEAGADFPTLEQTPEPLLYVYGTDESIWQSEHIWRFRARATDTAEIDVPRGKVVGGSSAVNDAQFLRAIPEDFDRWASWGNTEWAYAKILPYQKKLEADADFETEIHGADGPVYFHRFTPGEWSWQAQAFYQACRAAGFPDCADHNLPDATGVGPLAFNIAGRTRMSTAIAYLDPARARPGLTIRPHSLVHRVICEGKRAIGLRVIGENEVFDFYGDEIILCAGAIGSPHILGLSGIGPAAHLRELGIPIVQDLPGVGRNLRDHPDVPMAWRTRPGFRLYTDQVATGTVTLRHTAAGSPFKNDLVVYMGNYAAARPMRGADHEDPVGIGISQCLYLALSQGELRLQSDDPTHPPYLDFNLLDDPFDRSRLRESIRTCADLFKHAAFDEIVAERVAPSDEAIDDDAALDAWMRREVVTAHHVSSTCKMGPSGDPLAVVDQFGKVNGVAGLRICDASIMPDTVRANLNHTVIAMAEKVADFIKAE